MCIHACVWGMYMPICVYACVCVCGDIHVQCLCMFVYVCERVYISMCMHACVGGMYMPICVHVCVCVCVWVSEDDFVKLILLLLYVSSWCRTQVTRLILKVPFSAWPSHEPRLDAVLFQMIIPKHRFFYPFAFSFC